MKQLTENDVLTFGKYKGSIIGNMLLMDPAYLLWAEENVEWFEMTSDLHANVIVAEHLKAQKELGILLTMDNPGTTGPLVKPNKKGSAPLPVNRATPVITRESFKSPLSDLMVDDIENPFKDDDKDGMDFFLNSLDGNELGDAMGFDMNDYGDR